MAEKLGPYLVMP